MKSLISNLFIVTLFVCLSAKHGLSIKCYDCKTKLLDDSTEECRDKFGNSLTRECESFVCSIVVRTLSSGEGSITRGCGSNSNGTMMGAEITRADHGQYSDNGTHVSWSSCSTDLCNWNVTHKHGIREIDRMFEFSSSVRPEIHRDRRDIKCYVCSTDLDDDDKCAQGKEMETMTCHYGGCRIFKASNSQGEDVIRRLCDGPEADELISQLHLTKDKDTKNDKWKRFGVELSWSTCTTDLCNWGVMNTYQAMTLFVSALMCLSVYTLF